MSSMHDVRPGFNVAGPRAPLEITVLLDSPDEDWAAMDLVGEMLLEEWRSAPSVVRAHRVSIPIPRIVRRVPGAHNVRKALNADRVLGRYLAYPLRALSTRRPRRFFHVVDHSYAQLVHVLPGARTGVYCHDLDAFRSILRPQNANNGQSWPLRALARMLLRGLRRAAVVFFSTREVGDALERHGLVPRSRIVHAPYGVAPEFDAREEPNDGADALLAPLRGRPFLLHVGSAAKRKRIDLLFEIFARIKASHPNLFLVQQGALLSAEQRARLMSLGLEAAVVQPPKLTRATLAGLYRRASVVLVTSDAEGFGFPVIEALACGTPVVASDIPVLREVGADAAVYARVGDLPAWTAIVDGILRQSVSIPTRDRRIGRAKAFTWSAHAATILDAYRRIAMDRDG